MRTANPFGMHAFLKRTHCSGGAETWRPEGDESDMGSGIHTLREAAAETEDTHDDASCDERDLPAEEVRETTEEEEETAL